MYAIISLSFDDFKSTLRGDLIRPDDAGYDAARKVYNGMIDRRPSLVVRCSDVGDVISAINYARQNSLLVAVRGGGHHGAGFGVCDRGMVIDLSRMRGIRVDPKNQTVRAEGGCTSGDVGHAAHQFGLAIPGGTAGTTGVAGLTLGGGMGYLSRKYGLAIDNLVEADVVLADGSFVTVNSKENKELYWAIRGGGGNFGVVTSFLFKALPVSTVYAGPMLWPLDKAVDVMRWYREFSMSASEDLYGLFAFIKVPPGPPFPDHLHRKVVCAVVWCYIGPIEQANRVFEPIRKVGPPVFDLLAPMPYPALVGMFDPLFPPGLQWHWRGDFLNELSDDAINLHVKFCSELPSLLSVMLLYPVDGAVHRVGRNDTAFSYRDAKWSLAICGVDPDHANSERLSKWAQEYWEALHPYSMGGAYVNFMMDEGQSRVEAAYRDNYKRLSEIKRKYDPTNLFLINQNIAPA